MIASANLLHKAIKNSQMKILEGYYHGEMSMKHAKEYVKLLEKLVNKSDGTERVGYEEKDIVVFHLFTIAFNYCM